MDVEESKELTEGLATSPDFLSAFDYFLEKLNSPGEVKLFPLALFMFSTGYQSCLEFIEREKKFRSFKYDPNDCK